jgi:methylmalonyl-CoA mutase N-terminal domain/subunit
LHTEESSRIALRTQQVLAYETGVTKTIDPLAGSYYVEHLTDRIEKAISAGLADIEERGGMAKAIQEGWLEEQINAARYKNQRDIDSGRKSLVGVNCYRIAPEEDPLVEVHKIKADEWGEKRSEYLKDYRARRDQQKWDDAMSQLDSAWKNNENMVSVIMNALKNKVTMGEIHEAMRNAQSWTFR